MLNPCYTPVTPGKLKKKDQCLGTRPGWAPGQRRIRISGLGIQTQEPLLRTFPRAIYAYIAYIYAYVKHLLTTRCMQNTVLGTGDSAVKKDVKASALKLLVFWQKRASVYYYTRPFFCGTEKKLLPIKL